VACGGQQNLRQQELYGKVSDRLTSPPPFLAELSEKKTSLPLASGNTLDHQTKSDQVVQDGSENPH